MRWSGPDGCYADDDRSLVDVDRVHHWLSEESYWATGRPLELVRRSLDESLVIGVYDPRGDQVGFCRWVTDHASFAWLCDVFVDRASRGRGVGTFMVEVATSHPEVRDLRLLLLATRDAHDLYRRFGFGDVEPGRFLVRRR